MKSYTDLEQSKQLAKFLPFESADMSWCSSVKGVNDTDEYSVSLCTIVEKSKEFFKMFNGRDKCWKIIPCWSLAALLNVLPKDKYKDIDLCYSGYKGNEYIPEWFCSYEEQEPFIIEISNAPNAIDACYELVLKLHELKKI